MLSIARLLAPLVLLLVAAIAHAELKVVGPSRVDEYDPVEMKAEGAAEGSGYVWSVTDAKGKAVPPKRIRKNKDRVAFVGPPGVYTVRAIAIKLDPKTGETQVEEASVEVTIVGQAPAVKPIIQRFDATPTTIAKGGKAALAWSVFPPEAKVTLTDADTTVSVATVGSQVVTPTTTTEYRITAAVGDQSVGSTCTITVSDKPPDPPPSPSPIPVPGFRVLIVYESADLAKLPSSQSNILYARSVRDYLNAKCVVGPDGKTKEWWILDKDVDTSALEKHWQDAMKRPRASVPWIIISNHPTGGYEGPLPTNVDATLELLKKYGGA